MNYRTRIISSLSEIGQPAWDALLASQTDVNPFLSYAFLDALHAAGCAAPETGWQPQFLTLWDEQHSDQLAAVLPLYAKFHSYGEYVFDWAWADAYQRHGTAYYPKLLSAIPFTPVTGNRLLACDTASRTALLKALLALQQANDFSSTHILYPTATEATILQEAGFMLRSGVQFHWINRGYRDFDDFLATLEHKKRKNIRAERRKVRDAGVSFRHIGGSAASDADWRFFHRCYVRTYSEHYSTPYLNLDFFRRIGRAMPQNILLIVAERNDKPIASSLLIHDSQVLYGRYWGTLEPINCLHFETAYYQPLEFCIKHHIQRFEGGAQGEHKLARGFLPHTTWSAHKLSHPAFANAIAAFLKREAGATAVYLDELEEHNPFRTARPAAPPTPAT